MSTETLIDRQWLATMALIFYDRKRRDQHRLRHLTVCLIESDRICTRWSDAQVEESMDSLLIATREAMIPNTN